MPKKRTHKEFVELINLNYPYIQVVEKYVNCYTHIKFHCRKCGYEWNTKPNTLLNGKGCPYCDTKTPRKTTDLFIKEMASVNQRIEILGQYVNNETPILCRCKIDNNEWYEIPYRLLKGKKCPKCIESTKMTHCQFVERILEYHPNIEILNIFTSRKSMIKCRCKIDGYIWEETADNLLNKYGCPKCSKTRKWTQDEFIIKVKESNPHYKDMEIIGEYKGQNYPIKCRCKIDGYEWSPNAQNLLLGSGCPVCSHHKVKTGYNDIATTHPHLVKYFVDIKEANIYPSKSNQKVLMRCPECGYEKMQIIQLLTKKGFSCKYCDDNISYPNKFSYAFLQQLPVKNIIHEYSPDWANGRRYDNYFEYNNQAYILEMDGGFHYTNNPLNSQSAEKSQEIDAYKDEMAKEHNIILIRIDCRKSEKDYIKNNIIASQLNMIFDLNKINWEKCDEHTHNKMVKKVCDFFKHNPNYSTFQIATHFRIDHLAVYKYLNIGTNYGWCEYDGNKEREKAILKNSKSVKVYSNDNNYNIYEFKSIRECIERLRMEYGLPFTYNSIHKACDNNIAYHNMFFEWIN